MDELGLGRYSEDEVMYLVFDLKINVEVEPFVNWLRTLIHDSLEIIDDPYKIDGDPPRERILYTPPADHIQRYTVGIVSPLSDREIRPPLMIEQFTQYDIYIQQIKTDRISVIGFSYHGEPWKKLEAILEAIKKTYEKDLIEAYVYEENKSHPVRMNVKQKPWDQINEESGYDRDIVRLLWGKKSDQQIALAVGRSVSRVSSRLSDLRKLYPNEIVPNRAYLRKKGFIIGYEDVL